MVFIVKGKRNACYWVGNTFAKKASSDATFPGGKYLHTITLHPATLEKPIGLISEVAIPQPNFLDPFHTSAVKWPTPFGQFSLNGLLELKL